MYQWLMRTGRFWAIVVLVSLLLAYGIQWFQPYHAAEDRMTYVVLHNAGLETRLSVYGQRAQEWRGVIQPGVPPSQIIMAFFDSKNKIFKETFWGIVEKVPGGRIFLEAIVTAARKLVELDKTLEKVSFASSSSIDFTRMVDQAGYLEKEDLQQINAKNIRNCSGVRCEPSLKKRRHIRRTGQSQLQHIQNALTVFARG